MAYVPWSLVTKHTPTDFPFTGENGLGQSFAAISETPPHSPTPTPAFSANP